MRFFGLIEQSEQIYGELLKQFAAFGTVGFALEGIAILNPFGLREFLVALALRCGTARTGLYGLSRPGIRLVGLLGLRVLGIILRKSWKSKQGKS